MSMAASYWPARRGPPSDSMAVGMSSIVRTNRFAGGSSVSSILQRLDHPRILGDGGGDAEVGITGLPVQLGPESPPSRVEGRHDPADQPARSIRASC